MDRDLIYLLLLVVVVATFLVLLAAVWNARRRGAEPRQGGSDRTNPSDPVGVDRVDAVAVTAIAPQVVDPIDPIPTPQGSEVDDDHDLEALVDPLTGLGARLAWAEALRNEEYRLARYRHPTTVLVGELHGLDALAQRLGPEAADRLIPPVADALRRNARNADVLARVGHARFFVLMPETDEIAAINFVERVRAACDVWLEAGAVTVRLAIGWASPPAGGTLADALALAQARMNAARPSRGNSSAWGPVARPPFDRRAVNQPQADSLERTSMASASPTPEGAGTPS